VAKDTCAWGRRTLSIDFERTWWRLSQKRVVPTKFDIYVFVTITWSIPLLVDYKSRWYHPPSSMCFGTHMVQKIYFVSEFYHYCHTPLFHELIQMMITRKWAIKFHFIHRKSIVMLWVSTLLTVLRRVWRECIHRVCDMFTIYTHLTHM
jgi:hypothetical protein